MEVKIIPSVFATSIQTFNSKLEKLKFSNEIHLDFMDGKFTPKKSVKLLDTNKIKNHPNIKFETHLMAYNPIKYKNKLKDMGVKKILIHFEVFNKRENLIQTLDEFKKEKFEVFLVLNPNTNIESILNYTRLIDGIMLMSVISGAEGQNFIEKTYKRIESLRKNEPNVIIQIDGGIKDTNIEKMVKKGANILTIGSYISSSETPEDNFKKLNHLIGN